MALSGKSKSRELFFYIQGKINFLIYFFFECLSLSNFFGNSEDDDVIDYTNIRGLKFLKSNIHLTLFQFYS